MNATISEQGERIIRSLLESGRYGSEDEVIDDALRFLESRETPRVLAEFSKEADQELQRRLFEAGLLSKIKPSVRVNTGTEQFTPIKIEGEPLSETIIRERR
jgi:putative addiction module CopG family antidote